MSERETSVDSIAYVKIFPYVDKINIGLVLMYGRGVLVLFADETFSQLELTKSIISD